MTLDEYQALARKTVQDVEPGNERIIALLGLAGEAGELLSEYKKHLRDGQAHRLFPLRIREELGDLLWYVARSADLFDLRLQELADFNLAKTAARYGQGDLQGSLAIPHLFDSTYPENERLPRKMQVELRQVDSGERVVIHTFVNGERKGDDLTDNAYKGDGYRFHDVFHFSYAGVLGWSPVVRLILGCKRRSDSEVDEVEDGGRAKVIDEGISAMVFAYATDHGYLEGVAKVDPELLKTIGGMTRHLEVALCTPLEWESAIMQGYAVWRHIMANQGGVFLVDLDARTIAVEK